MKKVKVIRVFSSFLIICMLSGLFFFSNYANADYSSSFSNSDVIYNGNRNSNKISLMVNVYWGTEFIPKMLELFKDYGVKTTFFIGGTWAEKEQEMLNKIYADGHEIGNHGYFHLDQDKLNYDQNKEEIENTHKLIKVYLGLDMNLFAPPSGAFNNATLEVAKDLGYSTIMWSKDTIDWRDKDSSTIYSRATQNIEGGDLILMHPTEKTVEALPAMLEFYKLKGFEVSPVSEVLV